ncbi:MAG: hypothetical protein HY851_03840 [candidate division Zixibacteria bacterium]|nr:hypothetical protein [candidate division Zixibacteria bacterium]
MSNSRRFSRVVLSVIVLMGMIAVSFEMTAAQCGNADGDPSGMVDISDAAEIISHLILGTPIFNYANAEVDGYQDVTVSDFVFMINRMYCDSFNLYNRCLPLDTPLAPATRPGDFVWVDKGIYPPYSGNGTFYFDMYIKSVDTLRGFTFPFQVRIGDTLVPIVSIEKPDTLAGNPWIRYLFRDSLHGMVMGVNYDCWVPPGSYLAARVGVKGPKNNGEYDWRTFAVEWAPYPTPVSPISLAPVHKPIMVLKSYSAPVPADPMQTVIAVTPTISRPLQCPACWAASPVGSAVLLDSALDLVVDNIDSVGNSGVSLRMDPSWAHQINFRSQALSNTGSAMTVAVQGTMLGSVTGESSASTLETLLGWSITNQGGQLGLTVDFTPVGAAAVVASFHDSEVQLYIDTVPPATTLGTLVALDGSIPTVRFASVWEFSNPTLWVIFNEICAFTLPGGPTVNINEIHLYGLGRTKSIWSVDNWLVTGKSTRFVISDLWNGLPWSCCSAGTGDVDCSVDVDIGDVTTLIDMLFISHPALCCPKQANCDGSKDHSIDIADLSALIDNLFITFTPTAKCQ